MIAHPDRPRRGGLWKSGFSASFMGQVKC